MIQSKVYAGPALEFSLLVWFATLLLSELIKEMAALTPKELVNLLNIIEEVLCLSQFFSFFCGQIY